MSFQFAEKMYLWVATNFSAPLVAVAFEVDSLGIITRVGIGETLS